MFFLVQYKYIIKILFNKKILTFFMFIDNFLWENFVTK